MRRSDLELLAEMMQWRVMALLYQEVPEPLRNSAHDPFRPDRTRPDQPLVSIGIRTMAAQDLIDMNCQGKGDGYTYAIRSWRGGLTKIGQASDPLERLLSIQACSPEPFVLVGLCHGASVERALHKQFRAERRYAEMFDLGSVNPIPYKRRVCFGCRR